MMRFALYMLVAAAMLAGCRSADPAPPAVVPAAPVAQAPGAPREAPQAPRIIQPGAPGAPSRSVAAADAPRARIAHTAADVAFMKGMIGHHAQALEMTELLRTRTESEQMKMLAMRIDVSQSDEIRFMQHWLRARGEEVPGPHAHHMPGGHMPGMLTADEMARLAAARGPEFDRLFLAFMIRHHDGALVMVRELFEADGAGQEAEINAFTSDVVADQQMEIDRMAGMLRELQK